MKLFLAPASPSENESIPFPGDSHSAMRTLPLPTLTLQPALPLAMCSQARLPLCLVHKAFRVGPVAHSSACPCCQTHKLCMNTRVHSTENSVLYVELPILPHPICPTWCGLTSPVPACLCWPHSSAPYPLKTQPTPFICTKFLQHTVSSVIR